MVNISKTKRNFIWWHTLFAVISGALGAVILHFALPGHYFGGYPFIPIYFTSSGCLAFMLSTLAVGMLHRECYCCIWQRR